MTTPVEQQRISPLVAQLMEANLKQTQWVTDTVVNNLTEEATRLRVELAAVREGITELISGPWMPTPEAIHNALYPSRERIEYLRAEVES